MKAAGIVNADFRKQLKADHFFSRQNVSVCVWYCAKTPDYGGTKTTHLQRTDTSDDKKSNAPKGQGEPDEGRANSIDQLKEQIGKQVADTISWVSACDSSFLEFEQQLIPKVYELGRLFISLFLWAREEFWQRNHAEVEKGFKCQGLKDRLVCTIFGKVRYWRSYVYRGKYNGGYYPLDIELGLPWDGLQHAGPKLRGSTGDQNQLCSMCDGIKYIFTVVPLPENHRRDGAGFRETHR